MSRKCLRMGLMGPVASVAEVRAKRSSQAVGAQEAVANLSMVKRKKRTVEKIVIDLVCCLVDSCFQSQS